ncbi:inovirus Gp2 family protein [Vibrio aestuarianus subsp. cardii]|uniref:inovirus Gp2 family protein n=1 Tax=Vibrio aestuarianus TaxID=28171 RepID=UPI001593201B|nr:inovirus Gp2 family protein [Vibrio aestuarianus]MDE1311389.1 inovirus Gp2 family protein [Vibrio aestuarianus]NGZ93041.1 inovirus Gp2 family protein [Vibrio aestuarianus subsp. cardii]
MKTLKKKITHREEFNELPIKKEKEGLLVDYLQRIYDTLDLALEDHPRTFAVRIDLRLPLLMEVDKSNLMKNFMASLDAQIQADLRKKQRDGKNKRRCRLRYIWVREKDKSPQYHYHIVILLNRDVYYCVGEYVNTNNLSHKIKKAWCRALDIELDDGGRLVHFPKNFMYHLDINSFRFSTVLDQLFYRLSYFAKVRSKKFSDGYRNFGSSIK